MRRDIVGGLVIVVAIVGGLFLLQRFGIIRLQSRIVVLPDEGEP